MKDNTPTLSEEEIQWWERLRKLKKDVAKAKKKYGPKKPKETA